MTGTHTLQVGCSSLAISEGGPAGAWRPAPAAAQLVWELGEAPTTARLTPNYLATHNPAALLALVPRAAVLFGAGALSGAIAKSITAPLDRVRAAPLALRRLMRYTPGGPARSAGPSSSSTVPAAAFFTQVKILLQVKGGLERGAIAAAASKGNLLQAFLAIGREEGIMGYWKGNLPQVGAAVLVDGQPDTCAGHKVHAPCLASCPTHGAAPCRCPQVLRVVPYSAAQLYSYEVFKKLFQNEVGCLDKRGGVLLLIGLDVVPARCCCRRIFVAASAAALPSLQACAQASHTNLCVSAGGPPQRAAAPAGGGVCGHGSHAGEPCAWGPSCFPACLRPWRALWLLHLVGCTANLCRHHTTTPCLPASPACPAADLPTGHTAAAAGGGPQPAGRTRRGGGAAARGQRRGLLPRPGRLHAGCAGAEPHGRSCCILS